MGTDDKNDLQLKSSINSANPRANAMPIIGAIESFAVGVDDFETYLERMEQLISLNQINDDKMKAAFFISCAGGDIYKLFKSIVAPEKTTSFTYEQMTSKLMINLKPQNIIVAERYKFWKREQKDSETIGEFIVELHSLAQSCNFKTFLNEALRD